MRVLSAAVENFASYKQLTLDFSARGLVLVSGPTGAGKSTLCDIVPWVLFGRTAKDGSVDEVVSWGSEALTEGLVHVETGGVCWYVVRQRNPNDLYFTAAPYDERAFRGKDLADTQRLINDRLGMTYETYLTGAYFHEFSQTASFFTTTAKIRRQITEQLVDLSFAKELTASVTAYRREVKTELEDLKQSAAKSNHEVALMETAWKAAVKNHDQWEETRTARLSDLDHKAKNFTTLKDKAVAKIQKQLIDWDADRERQLSDNEATIKELETAMTLPTYIKHSRGILAARLQALGDGTCSECGAQKDHASRLVLLKEGYALDTAEASNRSTQNTISSLKSSIKRLLAQTNPHIALIDAERAKVNTYRDQADTLRADSNPFVVPAERAFDAITTARTKRDETQVNLDFAKVEADDLDTLSSVIDTLRTTLVKNTINEIQHRTNDLLSRHFDAEIKVMFEPEGADKLDVTIYKDGHQCSYTQLSKGQRQLLKLCFGVSAMRIVGNHNQTKFNCMFFDESLDGFDDVLKVKAYGLLQELSTEVESIFVVDHNSELKTRFENQIHVRLANGHSICEEA
jgi:DNA repair exonuclease SbcCD ATPase subunit